MSKPRFVVRSVAGWGIGSVDGGMTGSHPPQTDIVVLDAGNCYREVGQFPAAMRKSIAGGKCFSADERMVLAEALAARLELEYADPSIG